MISKERIKLEIREIQNKHREDQQSQQFFLGRKIKWTNHCQKVSKG